MTTPGELDPADYRRAAALMTHRAHADSNDVHDGVRAILDEAIEHGRLTRLLVALDIGYRTWVGHLRTPRAQAWLVEFIEGVAAEDEDRFNQLAAQAIRAMSAEDNDGFLALLQEVNADGDGGARLIGAVSDVYISVLPELATPSGRAALGEWTAAIAQHADGLT